MTIAAHPQPVALPTGTAFPDPAQLAARAAEVARILALLASPPRLMILCRLVESGRLSVGRLAGLVGLSQSALSQHLAKLRADGLVAFDRDGRTLHYRIADERVLRLMETLHSLYCTEET